MTENNIDRHNALKIMDMVDRINHPQAERNETERAIEWLDRKLKIANECLMDCASETAIVADGYIEMLLREKEAFTLAISALRAKSSAEAKLEKVREYCEYTLGEESIWDYKRGSDSACLTILEILSEQSTGKLEGEVCRTKN